MRRPIAFVLLALLAVTALALPPLAAAWATIDFALWISPPALAAVGDRPAPEARRPQFDFASLRRFRGPPSSSPAPVSSSKRTCEEETWRGIGSDSGRRSFST